MTADGARVLVALIPEEKQPRALVALLCGWHWEIMSEPDAQGYRSFRWTDPVGRRCRVSGFLDRHIAAEVPDYPNDMTAVFRGLVPAMRERKWFLGLEDLGNGRFQADWFRDTKRRIDGTDHALAEDGNPARAICLAAIRAVGWDLPGGPHGQK